jgi:hypothetical protein
MALHRDYQSQQHVDFGQMICYLSTADQTRGHFMKLYIGTCFRDLNQNLYQIMDVKYGNSHSQYPSSYLCVCHEGDNKGREMWVSRNTILTTELEEVR